MKISVSSYSFNKYIREGRLTQLDTIAKAAEMGFSGIEFTTLEADTGNKKEDKLRYAERLRCEAERHGIEIVAYCVGANLYRENAQERDVELAMACNEVDIAAELGAPIMRHDVCYSEKIGNKVVSFERQLPVIAENARAITEYAASKGIRTCSENHGFVAQDSDRVEKLYNAVGHENYGLLIDVGNFACADEDSIKAVSRLAPYAIHVHAKDFYISKYGQSPSFEGGFLSRGCNRLLGSVIGEGDIPTEQCLAILKKAGYDGFVSIEYEGAEDCVEGVRRGLENLKRMI